MDRSRILGDCLDRHPDVRRAGQEFAEQREIITRLDARLITVEERLVALEEKVDERLRETRPIWEGVLQRLAAIETALDTLNLRSRIEKLEDEQPTT